MDAPKLPLGLVEFSGEPGCLVEVRRPQELRAAPRFVQSWNLSICATFGWRISEKGQDGRSPFHEPLLQGHPAADAGPARLQQDHRPDLRQMIVAVLLGVLLDGDGPPMCSAADVPTCRP
jgi:hypothetical protein